MKRKIQLMCVCLLLTGAFTACKKDKVSLRTEIAGLWNIDKIVKAVYDSKDAVVSTSTYIGVKPNDHIQFRDDDGNTVEQQIAQTKTVGSYSVTLNRQFSISWSQSVVQCTIDNLDATHFQFTGTTPGPNGGKTVEVYSLSR